MMECKHYNNFPANIYIISSNSVLNKCSLLIPLLLPTKKKDFARNRKKNLAQFFFTNNSVFFFFQTTRPSRVVKGKKGSEWERKIFKVPKVEKDFKVFFFLAAHLATRLILVSTKTQLIFTFAIVFRMNRLSEARRERRNKRWIQR